MSPRYCQACIHPKVEVARQPITTLLTEQVPAGPTAQPSVAPVTPKQAPAQSPTAATHTQWMTPVTADIQPPTD